MRLKKPNQYLLQLLAIALMYVFYNSALSQVYMCQQDGRAVFQDSPCVDVKDKKADLCSQPLSAYSKKVNSGKASSVDKMCHAKLKKQAEEEERAAQEAEKKRLAAEAREKAREESARKAEELRQIREAEKAEQLAQKEKEKAELEERKKNAIQTAIKNNMYAVEYRVGGSSFDVSVTINGADGTEQHDAHSGWWKMILMKRGDFAYLSAQNQKGYGDVVSEIWVNGVKVKSAKATASYGIATVNMRVR